MTRANLTIKTIDGSTIKVHWGSDAYPKDVKGFLYDLAALGYEPDLDWMNEHNPAGSLHFGHVGNPYYFYEVDQQTLRVSAWNARTRWVNAPANWKERGWGCWQGKNGQYGYTNWIKGAPISFATVEAVSSEKDS